MISNSLKYCKQDVAPVIKIYSRISEAETKEKNLAPTVNSYCRIFIEDNGIGFEDEQAEAIFDTFIRLNPKDKYEGTGLGLALCKKIAERHGGSISAKGETGQGAKFRVMLPLHQSKNSI